MLIDDDRMFNFLNKRIIEKLDTFNEICLFENARNALEDIREKMPEFILLDLMMPVMNGFQFLDELEKLPSDLTKNIKVIVLTSSLLEEDYNKSMQYHNVIGFLTKPLDTNKIRTYIS